MSVLQTLDVSCLRRQVGHIIGPGTPILISILQAVEMSFTCRRCEYSTKLTTVPMRVLQTIHMTSFSCTVTCASKSTSIHVRVHQAVQMSPKCCTLTCAIKSTSIHMRILQAVQMTSQRCARTCRRRQRTPIRIGIHQTIKLSSSCCFVARGWSPCTLVLSSILQACQLPPACCIRTCIPIPRTSMLVCISVGTLIIGTGEGGNGNRNGNGNGKVVHTHLFSWAYLKQCKCPFSAALAGTAEVHSHPFSRAYLI